MACVLLREAIYNLAWNIFLMGFQPIGDDLEGMPFGNHHSDVPGVPGRRKPLGSRILLHPLLLVFFRMPVFSCDAKTAFVRPPICEEQAEEIKIGSFVEGRARETPYGRGL